MGHHGRQFEDQVLVVLVLVCCIRLHFVDYVVQTTDPINSARADDSESECESSVNSQTCLLDEKLLYQKDLCFNLLCKRRIHQEKECTTC